MPCMRGCWSFRMCWSFRIRCHGCIAYGYETNRLAHFGQTSVRRVVRNVGPVPARLSACRQRCSLLRCLLLMCLPLLHCSIELLYYRTSVPSNERLVREADVNATVVAERRPYYLQLVTDHGRLVNPAFVPGEPIWVARVPAGAGQAAVRAVNSGRPPVGRPPSAAGRRDRAAHGQPPVRLTRRGRLVITSAVVAL